MMVRIIEQNKKCQPDEVVYEWHERSYSDEGITWGNIDVTPHLG